MRADGSQWASPNDALANSRTSNREFRLIGCPAAGYRGRAGLLVIRHLERGRIVSCAGVYLTTKAEHCGVLAAAMISASERTRKMKFRLVGAAFAISLLPAAANAQVTIDMNAFTCQQYLAMSPEMSRDFSAWMSGWFSYETRRTFVDLLLHQKNIANLKSWCQRSPQASVMTGLRSSIPPE